MRLRPSRLLTGLLIVVAAIALALAVAQDQETLQLRSGVAAADAGSPAYLAALTGAPVSTGNRFTILNNGDEMFPAMLGAIDRARARVRFETFVFEDGELATRFVEAFERAAHRGVTVDIVVDFIGASDMAEQHLERLRAAGCRVISYNEAEWYHLEEVNYRTHRKILVVDGQVAFTGGAGLADHWLGHAQDPEHWRDIQVGIQGPVARLLEAAFYENFVELGAPVTPRIGPAPSVWAGGAMEVATGSSLVVRSSASGGSSDMKRLYLLLIASARRTLDIASPYFVSDESSEWALDDAVKRGVRVRVLTEGDHTDARPVKYASRRNYDRLIARGIQIAEYQPTMFHAKVMVVDGVWSMFGSANFDNRSLELNDELNVAVHDADLASRFGRIFEDDLRRAKALTLPEWRRRPLGEKAREFFWGYWGEIF
ncbi:MAG: phosphatidylserine/phosphatidylglycerophosphate/cardiolipin synthase family protein [Vicinamibacterales bacterium]